MPPAKFDLNKILAAHDAATVYAFRVQKCISKKAEEDPKNLVAAAALSTLAHECVCLHRAISDLARAGWAFAAPILLRSLLEAGISIAVIIESARPDVTAFKYFYSYVKDFLRDPATHPAPVLEFEDRIRAEAEAGIKANMAQMSPEDSATAEEWLRKPSSGHFWYSDEFSGPTKILEKHFSSETLYLYRTLSSAAHAGFIGMRMFRDDPELRDINPRKNDVGAIGMAMVLSAKLLADITRVRAKFARVGDLGYDQVYEKIRQCNPNEAKEATAEPKQGQTD
jgi:hypothetical protein